MLTADRFAEQARETRAAAELIRRLLVDSPEVALISDPTLDFNTTE